MDGGSLAESSFPKVHQVLNHYVLANGVGVMVNISEVKTHLLQLIERVSKGEKIVIAKNNFPIADLVVHQPEAKRTLGLLQGKWDAPEAALIGADAEIEAMFYGEAV